MAVDPIHQFEIDNMLPIVQIGAAQIHLTNSAIFMAISVGLTMLLLLGTTRSRRLVPTRMQSVAELTYELMANTLRNVTGDEGMKFFPFVFSLFMFILFANLVGLIPYGFTVTSHLIITAALALLVFFTVIIYGFWKNGLAWLKLFVPSGIPTFMIPLIVVIELLSFFSRPISHSVRLFANMLAGHITLKLVAGFIGMLGGVGFVGWLGAIAPLALTVALTALEFLVAALQAFVFAILTCIYLNDAIHPSHDPHPAH
jgi:F-type H+-transporting ATPase subunit a